MPGEVKCGGFKEGQCPPSMFNEDGFRDEMLCNKDSVTFKALPQVENTLMASRDI